MEQIQTSSRKSSWLSIVVILGLIGFACYELWQAWPSLVLSSIKWQREINGQLSDLLYDAKNNSLAAGISLAGLSFIYGALHSLGPGHGKMIVTTYLATNPTKIRASLTMTIVSALMQAVVAVALVSTLLAVFNASMRQISSQADQFILFSSFAVVALGAWVGLKAIKKLIQAKFSTPPEIKQQELADKSAPKFTISAIKPLQSSSSNSINAVNTKPTPALTSTIFHTHQHDNNGVCGCGHKHVVSADEINNATTWKEYAGIIFSIGIRPCTGAVMVLLFANMVGIYWLGVVSAFVMALGTAMTTSIIAIMTITGKSLVKRYLNHNPNSNSQAGTWAQLIGGIILVLFGLLLVSSHSSGISPVL
ncbi:TPA: nickel/cobalt transporter [Photobacterium damselae]